MIWPAIGLMTAVGVGQLCVLIGKEQNAGQRFTDIILISWSIIATVLLLRLQCN